VQEVPKFVPVALDLLKAAESFPLCGRKTGNECRSLTPIVDDMPSKYDRDTSSKTDEKNCPEHSATPVQNSLGHRTGRNMLQCGGDILRDWTTKCSSSQKARRVTLAGCRKKIRRRARNAVSRRRPVSNWILQFQPLTNVQCLCHRDMTTS
jgi:hypothetical protein